MPIYEYRCRACGTKFEKLVSLSARARDVECPACGQRKARKTVSLVGRVSGGVSASTRSETACAPSG